MVDWSKPIQTRDGRPARYLCEIKRKSLCTRLVAITTDGEEATMVVDMDGQTSGSWGWALNIINVPPKKLTGEFWVNIYPGNCSAGCHESKAEADCFAASNRIACKCVQWTEGDDL